MIEERIWAKGLGADVGLPAAVSSWRSAVSVSVNSFGFAVGSLWVR